MYTTYYCSNLASETIEESEVDAAAENPSRKKGKKGVVKAITSWWKTKPAQNPNPELPSTEQQLQPHQGSWNIGDQMSHTLGTVQVSKRQYDDYQAQMKNQLVSEWKEGSIAKVYQGVELAKYPQFLDNFQRVTGVDQKIRTDFENMEFTDMLSDKLKVFTCDGTDVGGKYGMYMAVKRPDEVLMSFFAAN